MIHVIFQLVLNFCGSLCAFVIAQHYHLEDHWAERKERIEAKRAQRRWQKGSEEDNQQRERGYRANQPPPRPSDFR
jgi:hypothetical protein